MEIRLELDPVLSDGHSDNIPLLVVDGLTKRFGGVEALNEVSFRVAAGSVTAVIGPNGAGKTTLFNTVAGVHRPDAGRVFMGGLDVTGWAAHRICATGIGRTFQNIRLFASLNVLENVLVALRNGKGRQVFSGLTGKAAQADALLQSVGLERLRLHLPSQLSYGDRRRLEIARALATQPRLLMLDEPAAGMIASEVDRLVELISTIRGSGLTILLIEHNMRMVMRISDHVVVLNFGTKIAEGSASDIRRHDAVLEAYLGADREPGEAVDGPPS